MDADYELSSELISEILDLWDDGTTAGYRAGFVYRIHGRPLRGSLYPPRTVLYRRASARYHIEGHAHKVAIDGPVCGLVGVIFHDDRKSLGRWLVSQAKYAALEADHLLSVDVRTLSRADRLRRRAWPAPVFTLFYVLFVKGCFFDGWVGWYYALQRFCAEVMLSLKLLDVRLHRWIL